jgi:hypothetical protein
VLVPRPGSGIGGQQLKDTDLLHWASWTDQGHLLGVLRVRFAARVLERSDPAAPEGAFRVPAFTTIPKDSGPGPKIPTGQQT